MLNFYEGKINELSELYQKTNSLLILYETYAKKSRPSYAYQLKDAYNHLMDAIKADIEIKDAKNVLSDEEEKIRVKTIENELGACRNHLFRLAFDVGEETATLILRKTLKTFDRVPKVLVSKIFPKFNEEIRPKIHDYLNKIVDLKLEKGASSSIDVIRKLYDLVQEIKEFSVSVFCKNKNYKWQIAWMIIGFVFTSVVSALIGFGLEKWLGL